MAGLYPSLNWQDVEQYSEDEIKNSFGGFLLETLPGPKPSDGFDLTDDTQEEEVIKEKKKKLKDDKKEENSGTINDKLKIGPLEGHRPSKDQSLTFRYPEDAITSETDYVFFQFGKYVAPFSQDQEDLRKQTYERKKKFGGTTTKSWEDMGGKERAETNIRMQKYNDLNRYNSNIQMKPEDAGGNAYESIMLPIPQDLGHEVTQQWQGKQWSATGRAATAALGAGNFSDAAKLGKDISGWATAAQASLTEMALNVMPGVGGNITFNDLTGATKGIVINPNAELMYDSPEMREIGMVFKMVPKNPKESKIIRRICQAFRKHSMPMYGGADESSTDLNSTVSKKLSEVLPNLKKDDSKMNMGSMNNFIRVPNLCKFTFMHGNRVHPYLVQFKPCAISKVEVTYTPDGNYSTYTDGAPAAVELRINFMETKTIFASEVNYDGVSF